MTKYTYQEVFDASVVYFNGDDLAAKVFVDKYALQDNDGKYDEKTPDDMHKRLSKQFARIEKKYPNAMNEEEIYGLLQGFKYIVPQGSPMSAIGNDYQVQSLSNCFVIQGVHTKKLDSYGGILLADQELAQIFKRRGGCGLDISGIRPSGMRTSNAAKTTDGISVFMERFSNTCREVAMGGRRGAEMQTISVNHPDIETFITIKRDLKKATGANISIKITDEFMKAVKKNADFTLRWPTDVDPKQAEITKIVNAKELWDKIIQSAWQSAEPGLLFWDTVMKSTPSDIYKDFGHASISTNPCGEIILPAYDACRLLVLNLSSYVKEPFTDKASFDFDLFAEHTIKAQRLMDDVIDLELEQIDKIIAKVKADPEDEEVKAAELNLWKKIRKMNVSGRRTGLGITALGDCFAMLDIKYGSDASIKMTGKIYKALATNAYTSSCIMAQERGAFPIFDYELEKDHQFLKHIFKQCDEKTNALWKKSGRRNIALTTTAPTGSVSTLTQTSSGIEPIYLLEYKRRKKINSSDNNVRVDFTDESGDTWQEFLVQHNGVKQWAAITGKTNIKQCPYYGATSNEIDWSASVDIQAEAQKWICHSISKTCNVPSTATKELISEVYMKAWETGCKGFTVYRDGCRTGVLVRAEEPRQSVKPGDRPITVQSILAPKRPNELICDIKKSKIQGESWTFFVGLFDGRPYEIFGGLSKYVDIPNKYKQGKIVKNGKVNNNSTYNLVVGEGDDQMAIKDIASVFENATYGSFTRTLSLALRHGTPVQYVVEQLQKDKHSDITSFATVISRVFKQYIADGAKTNQQCPTCKADNSLVYQEGCMKCLQCPFSRC